MAGLGEAPLLTVEGLAACLRRVGPEGLLTVCREIQTPPRDSLKLHATLFAALRLLGVERPGERLVVVRDFLAVCTVVRGSTWRPEHVARLRREIARVNLTPVWFPGIRATETNQPDELPAAPGGQGDWYHYGIRRLLERDAAGFIAAYRFDIRPPTDDRPFFHDFSRLFAIEALREAYGSSWLVRAELAYLFLLAALALVAGAGALLILLPLLARPTRGIPGRPAALLYFAAIGLAYMLIEMTALSRLTHLVGDPVHGAALTIGVFLASSGAGCLLYQQRPDRLPARPLLLALLVVAALELLLLGRLGTLLAAHPLWLRSAGAALAVAPLGLLMGVPMPAALLRLERGAPALVPWAWGINGCASVLATPLAVALAMTRATPWRAGWGLPAMRWRPSSCGGCPSRAVPVKRSTRSTPWHAVDRASLVVCYPPLARPVLPATARFRRSRSPDIAAHFQFLRISRLSSSPTTDPNTPPAR